MKYGIICATPEEFGALETLISTPRSEKIFDRNFIYGKINGNDVVTAVSRIGKVAAGITTSLIIDRFKVDAVIFCGIAGSLCDDVKIGDIVVGEKCVHHDFSLSSTDKFRVPLLDMSYMPCDPLLSDKCTDACIRFFRNADKIKKVTGFFERIKVERPNIHRGVIASGDQFVNELKRKIEIKQSLPEAKCVEMEGAAVAQVCVEAHIPCAVIRVISDGADDDADIRYDEFVSMSSIYTMNIISEFFK